MCDIILWGNSAVDPAMGSIINLIGGLGSAAAAVVVVWLFLSYLKAATERQEASDSARDARYADLAERQATVIRDNSEALREFRRGVDKICRGPGQ